MIEDLEGKESGSNASGLNLEKIPTELKKEIKRGDGTEQNPVVAFFYEVSEFFQFIEQLAPYAKGTIYFLYYDNVYGYNPPRPAPKDSQPKSSLDLGYVTKLSTKQECTAQIPVLSPVFFDPLARSKSDLNYTMYAFSFLERGDGSIQNPYLLQDEKYHNLHLRKVLKDLMSKIATVQGRKIYGKYNQGEPHFFQNPKKKQ